MIDALPTGVQGYEMYIDENGDSEANYTVLALTTNKNADITDLERRRVLSQIGHFHSRNDSSPVRRFHQRQSDDGCNFVQTDWLTELRPSGIGLPGVILMAHPRRKKNIKNKA